MSGSAELCRKPGQYRGNCGLLVLLGLACACNPKAADRSPELGDAARTSPVSSAFATASSLSEPAPNAPVASASASAANAAGEPEKIDFQDVAMGTNVHFIAYTNPQADAAQIKTAITRALAEMRRLEGLMSEWRDDSEVGK